MILTIGSVCNGGVLLLVAATQNPASFTDDRIVLINGGVEILFGDIDHSE